MAMYFSPSRGGFFSTSIHRSLFIPLEHGGVAPDPAGPIADAVEVTRERYIEIFQEQSKGPHRGIVAGEDGHPILSSDFQT